MSDSSPVRPENLDPLAEEILEALRQYPESREVVLGGYFALKHYADYRATHDLDAWWRTGKTEAALKAIRRVMREVAERRGLRLNEREWGEVVSLELLKADRKVFSFQIAVRSMELEPARESPWPPILLESLADNVGAKMNALVQRGAPRDFMDVRELVARGLATVPQCWRWWGQKNPGADVAQAKANALRHLEALEQRRPLERIEDSERRADARRAREWIRRFLLQVPWKDPNPKRPPP